MRVLVTGGRDYKEMQKVHDWLTRMAPTMVIHGGCPTGADRFAHYWCMWHPAVYEKIFFADWTKDGKAAGPIRNQRMVDELPDVVLAFPGGRGTADCVRRAKRDGIRIEEVQ